MLHGIEITILWFDDDLVDVLIRGNTGNFAGVAYIFVGHEDIARLAEGFRGFPISSDDRREIVLGSFNDHYSGGGARFLLRTDTPGHVMIELRLRADSQVELGPVETVDLVVPVEAAAIDRFVAVLESMPIAPGTSAYLPHAGAKPLRNPCSGDSAAYAFLTSPGAYIACQIASGNEGQELQIFGNRSGLLSMANILLWFVANAWRREFLSLGELGFVRMGGLLSVSIRLTDEESADGHGTIRRQDRGESLEWAMSEEGARVVAHGIHGLASVPEREYDRLLMTKESVVGVHVRMTDVTDIL